MPTNLAAEIHATGPFPTHLASEGRGGYRSVADATARDAIPIWLRDEGMEVLVLAGPTRYRLAADLTTWVEVSVAGPPGADGEAGADGHSPALSWGSGADADRILVDGTATGPHLTGPAGADGAPGEAGADGAPGADGADGAAGVGVPAGGTTGQVLKKKSGADYDTEWSADNTGSGSDEWRTCLTATILLAAQVSASRMGFADGWIDSMLDASGMTLANCVAVFSAGAASGPTGGIATPTMTSNTAPSGVASASAEFSSTYAAWKAFNRTNVDSSDAWLADTAILANPATWRWLKFDFGASSTPTIGSYTIITRNYGAATHPKTWIFQGSNDNSTWTDLHSVTGDTSWTYNQSRTFTCDTSAAYRYYRLLIKESGAEYCAIGELQMITAAAPLTLESAPATVASGSEYLCVLAVNAGGSFTVQVDAGAGWETVSTTRTAQSATVDQLSGTLTRSGGSSVKARVVAADASGVVYGMGLFWR